MCLKIAFALFKNGLTFGFNLNWYIVDGFKHYFIRRKRGTHFPLLHTLFNYMLEVNQDTFKLLRESTVFEDFTDNELVVLMSIAHRERFEEDQAIFKKERGIRYFYMVESGRLMLRLRNNRVKTFSRGDIFGEIGVINQDLRRMGSIRVVEASMLILFDGDKLFEEAIFPTKIALKVLRALAKQITNYLRSQEEISTRELITKGESEYVEFKQTLRWDTNSKKKDRLVEHAVLRAIAGFLNTSGGTILIGVTDDRKVIGLKHDNFENNDKMLLHLTKLIKEYISPLHTRFVHYEIEAIHQKSILRIDVEPSSIPAYLRNKDTERFYIRIGPSTNKLPVSKIYDYICMRFYPNRSDVNISGPVTTI